MPNGESNIGKDSGKSLDIAVVVIGIIMLFADFLPISIYSGYYETISYIKGITYLLYIVPFFVIGPAVASLYGKLPKAGIWYAVVGGIGLLLAFIAGVAGNEMLAEFLRFTFGTVVTPNWGIGAVLMLLGYIAVAVIGVVSLKGGKSSQQEDVNTTQAQQE